MTAAGTDAADPAVRQLSAQLLVRDRDERRGGPVAARAAGAGAPAAALPAGERPDRGARRPCAHRAAPLSMGTSTGTRSCTLPRLHVRRRRQCVGVPSQPHVPYGAQVRSYPVRERPPFVWVWPGNPVRCANSSRPTCPRCASPAGRY